MLLPPGSTDRAAATLPRCRSLARGLSMGLAFTLASAAQWVLQPTLASTGSSTREASRMLKPETGSLLLGYYEAFLRDQDQEAFRQRVSSRYTEGTLARILRDGEPQARRASLLALGLFGSYASNAAVAQGLRDSDPTVRALASDALWDLWYRADTPENNEALAQIRALVGRGRLDQAIERANALIARSPTFAEAYNQRAIAFAFSGRFAESIDDCRRVLVHNPYHIGALGGMGQCQLRLGLRNDALDTFRRALKLQPYSESLKEVIGELDKELR